MPYNKNTANKALRRKFLKKLSALHIKSYNFTFPQIGLIIGISLLISSLFVPWFSSPYDTMNNSAFSGIIGTNGYSIVFISAISIFLLFSQSAKQKLKFFFNNSLNEANVFLFFSILLFLNNINSFIIIDSLYAFSNEIKIYNGITLSFVGTIIFFVSAIHMSKTSTSKSDSIYINESNQGKKHTKLIKKNTTKLPF